MLAFFNPFMKKIIALLIVLCLYGEVFAQNEIYFVLHLRGTIINKTTDKTLQVGDRLRASDQIFFNPNTTQAVLISSTKGRFVLGKPTDGKPSAGGEFLAYLKSAMIPMKSNGQLSTRGVEDEAITDFKAVFQSSTFVFPGGTSKIVLNPALYPMTHQKFFIYRYLYNGKAVNKNGFY